MENRKNHETAIEKLLMCCVVYVGGFPPSRHLIVTLKKLLKVSIKK